MIDKDAPQPVCSECLQLYDLETRQVPEGWKGVKWLTGGSEMCVPCMEKAVKAKAAKEAS